MVLSNFIQNGIAYFTIKQVVNPKLNIQSEDQITSSLKKRARNANISIILVLLFETLDLQFYSFNMMGAAVVKIGNQENIQYWLWLFFGFYAFRYLQEYFFGGSEARLSRSRKELTKRWTYLMLPRQYSKALKLKKGESTYQIDEQNSGDFQKTHLVDNKRFPKQVDHETKYILRVKYVDDPLNHISDYIIIPNQRLLKFYFSLFWFPAFCISLLSKPNYLTVHLPFLGYVILLVHFLI